MWFKSSPLVLSLSCVRVVGIKLRLMTLGTVFDLFSIFIFVMGTSPAEYYVDPFDMSPLPKRG